MPAWSTNEKFGCQPVGECDALDWYHADYQDGNFF
jgi:hypothetical protein